MKHYDIKDNTVTITYTIEENYEKQDPLYLENLTYDLPLDIESIESLTIKIVVPKEMFAHIVDDLHFATTTKTSNIEIVLHESSQATYRLFVANHHLCETCPKQEQATCQTIPSIFEKSIQISLIQPHAQAYINCHYLGDKTSVFHIATTQHHLASDTTSKLIVKGVLDDQAKLVSDNTIKVEKNLYNIIAEQTNKNLILEQEVTDGEVKPHVISIPKLEIDSQDVSCKHGATIKSIDKNELFYLQSRGIDKDTAERMIIEAFLQ